MILLILQGVVVLEDLEVELSQHLLQMELTDKLGMAAMEAEVVVVLVLELELLVMEEEEDGGKSTTESKAGAA
jgi:hypothetical protein